MSYGSVSESRLETEQSPMDLTGFGRRFTPEVRNRTVTPYTEVQSPKNTIFTPESAYIPNMNSEMCYLPAIGSYNPRQKRRTLSKNDVSRKTQEMLFCPKMIFPEKHRKCCIVKTMMSSQTKLYKQTDTGKKCIVRHIKRCGTLPAK